jgi:hypothetical protein
MLFLLKSNRLLVPFNVFKIVKTNLFKFKNSIKLLKIRLFLLYKLRYIPSKTIKPDQKYLHFTFK